VQVSGLTASVYGIGAGSSFACASQSPGPLWCWGSNSNGQLGAGISDTGYVSGARSAPVQVVGLSDVQEVGTGFAVENA
jgi:alpha-tubulin suppressor-like RCC1 family protein